jgi:tetratricopeptide (TPR) repeat protein
VRHETKWAFTRLRREPSRILLPVLAGTVEEDDIWLWLQDFKRVEAPGIQPYAQAEAVTRTLHALQLTLPGEVAIPTAPQPAESADDLMTRGKALLAQDEHAEALELFQRATQLDPCSFDAWFNIAYTFAHAYKLDERYRYQEAVDALDRALAMDPNNAAAWYNKGNALYHLMHYDEALAAYDRALALDPNDADARIGKGAALYGLQRLQEALVDSERALARDPNSAVAWYNQGAALENLNRFAEALAAYEHGFNPRDTRDWDGKARCLRALGRTREAEEAERRAKELRG